MRFGTAIERLVDNYQYAKSKIWIRDEVAWALYHTWKEADDRKTEPTQNQHIQSVESVESVGEDRKTENSSEKPNNCEHITEDGVTCAKYPACGDCLDNLLNKVKGSERLLKGKDEPQTNKEIVLDPSFAELSDEQFVEAMKLIEPQTDCGWK